MSLAHKKVQVVGNNNDSDALIRYIADAGVEFVDFRFTDPNGQWHHMAVHTNSISPDFLASGITFDGSSINGWRTIDDSDMILVPDVCNATVDPLSEQPSLILFCDVYDPNTGQPYTRDPRSIAKKAEDYLIKTEIADKAYFGPEPEFFVFDEVHYEAGSEGSFYTVCSEEGGYPSGPMYNKSDIRSRNHGHRPNSGGGYFPVAPIDSGAELRGEMCSVITRMGLKVEKHHHEVAPSQHEIGFANSTLVNTADNLQIFKYAIRMVAHRFGKTATFMPKPIYGENGSGMHVHQSLWKDGGTLFSGAEYAGLSKTAMYYIGGILKHARVLNAFTNPTTNSYKRLVPGYEAPVFKAYSAKNRSVAVRIPHTSSSKASRLEARFPDASSNPYLALSAMMMAGIDGIRNKIEPGEAVDLNLYDVNQNRLGNDSLLCTSLHEALSELGKNRGFLTEGGVFTDDMIDAYIALKQEQVCRVSQVPHPMEFQLYYSS